MKEVIIVELFDNGISVKINNGEDTSGRVALEHDIEKEIGKTIWETIKYVMDKDLVNIVKLHIEYTDVAE